MAQRAVCPRPNDAGRTCDLHHSAARIRFTPLWPKRRTMTFNTMVTRDSASADQPARRVAPGVAPGGILRGQRHHREQYRHAPDHAGGALASLANPATTGRARLSASRAAPSPPVARDRAHRKSGMALTE